MKIAFCPSVTSSRARVLVGLLMLANAGCLEFEKQTMVVVIPKEGQEVRALMVYHGLHVSGKKAQDVEKAKEQLTELVRGDTFYMGGSLFRVYLKPGKYDKPQPWDVQAMKVLNKHVVPGKGILVTDKEGYYSYCQPLMVRDTGPFVEWLNRIIGEEILDMIHNEPKGGGGKKIPPIVDGESMKMIEKAANKNFPFLRLEPGRIAFTLPGTRKFFAEIKREFAGGNMASIKKDVEALLDPATKDKVLPDKLRKGFDDWEYMLKLLGETPFSFDQRSNQFTLALGWGDDHPFRLTMESSRPPAVNQENKDLYAFAQTLGVPVRNDVSIDQVLEGFEKTLALPKKKAGQ